MQFEFAPLVLQGLQVLAACASAAAAYLSFTVARENKRLSEENLKISRRNRLYTRDSTNRAAVAKHEEMIAQHPQLLELHGIDSSQLSKLGISNVEAGYLLSSFSAGNLYYLDGEITELTDYRKRLLASRKVRLFWKNILENRIIGPSPFCELVNSHIARHYAKEDSDT